MTEATQGSPPFCCEGLLVGKGQRYYEDIILVSGKRLHSLNQITHAAETPENRRHEILQICQIRVSKHKKKPTHV